MRNPRISQPVPRKMPPGIEPYFYEDLPRVKRSAEGPSSVDGPGRVELFAGKFAFGVDGDLDNIDRELVSRG